MAQPRAPMVAAAWEAMQLGAAGTAYPQTRGGTGWDPQEDGTLMSVLVVSEIGAEEHGVAVSQRCALPLFLFSL